LCGLYDIKPESGKFGVTDSVIKLAPDQHEIYNGFDFNVNARLPRGVVLSGGTSTGRTQVDQCFKLGHPEYTFTANAPYAEAFCDDTPPFQTQIKGYAVYPLPWWGVRTSATYRSVPGPPISANAVFTTNEIAATRRSVAGLRAAPPPRRSTSWHPAKCTAIRFSSSTGACRRTSGFLVPGG